MMKFFRHMLLAALVLTGICGCVRRPLYIEDATPVKVIVMMDWFELGGDPQGASICFYPEGGGAPYVFLTNSVNRTTVSVPAGYYTVLVYNRTINEFGTFSFHDMDNLGKAGITLYSKNFSWIDSRQDTVGRTVCEPEAIVVGRTDHFRVRSLVERVQSYNESNATRGSIEDYDCDFDSVSVYEKRMVMTGNINIRITGIQNIKSVRGYLNGMAGEAYLATRQAGDTLATHVLEHWAVNRDDEDYTTGSISTSFNCLGLPEQYKFDRLPEHNQLVVRILLQDNQTVVARTFDVGDRIEEIEEELLVYLNVGLDPGGEDPVDNPIDLPDVAPEGGSASGFDVDIIDWGDTTEVVIPMMVAERIMQD